MKKVVSLMVACLVLVSAFALFAQETVALPKPKAKGMSLADALKKVLSDRVYADKALAIPDLSYVLWVTAGNRFGVDTYTGASRTYPSAFGIYPVRMYLLVGKVDGVKPGFYQYAAADHGLKLLKEGDFRTQVVEGSQYALFAAQAPATLVVTADLGKISGERGRTVYLPMEVGYVAQTMRLAAASAGLSSGIIGSFEPAKAKALFGIKDEPILLLPFGYPR